MKRPSEVPPPVVRLGRAPLTASTASPTACDSFPGAVSQILTNMVVNSLMHGFERDQPGRIRIHAALDGDTVAFDYEPQVWRLLRPYRLRSHPVAGPDFPDLVLGEVAFTPWPLPKADV